MAEKGAPPGNDNAAKGTRWRQAIDKAIKQYSKGDVKRGQALDRIAEKLVDAAITKEGMEFWQALKEIGDRLDGKPHATIDNTITLQANHEPRPVSDSDALLTEALRAGKEGPPKKPLPH